MFAGPRALKVMLVPLLALGEVVLRKELGAFPKYGVADKRADLIYTGQQATWHFTLLASIDPATVRGA